MKELELLTSSDAYSTEEKVHLEIILQAILEKIGVDKSTKQEVHGAIS